jgi:hypothetical protein
MNQEGVRSPDALREIIRHARDLASESHGAPGLRNRALEIAAMAESMLWSVDPDASDWLTAPPR